MKPLEFQRLILGWYRLHGRHDLPWRKTRDPYRILVSEIMLQQTQVDRVRGKYTEFLKAFPTVHALANASPSAVLRVWKGLGYNRRALNLQRAARLVAEEYRGRMPRDLPSLLDLPGVGPYTARAVRVFAWNRFEVFIETNIRRVFIHHFLSDREKVYDRELVPFIERTLPAEDPRTWYWALMDYGAGALKKMENPNRKSKHYARQSRFPGSQRYARAKVLDFVLLQKKPVALAQLQTYMAQDAHLAAWRDKALYILSLLVAEGFLEQIGRKWSGIR